MLVDNDAAAEMLPAPVLAVEEWHGLLKGARRVEVEVEDEGVALADGTLFVRR